MAADATRKDFEAGLAAHRPRLHRYCARMMGSAFDGEDVTQEALAKAAQAFDAGARPEVLEAWLMRIAHNAAMDALRARARRAETAAGDAAALAADPAPTPEERSLAASSMQAFLALPVAQRSAVILMDVLGYSLDDITGMTRTTLPSVKAALHRGRAALRAAAHETSEAAALSPAQRALYLRYAERFNARDFDAIRDMLAEEVWLDMVARTRMKGPAEIRERYMANYGASDDWRLSLGVVDGRPALLVHNPHDTAAAAAYFVELRWAEGKVMRIRDYRYARYVTDGAEAYRLA